MAWASWLMVLNDVYSYRVLEVCQVAGKDSEPWTETSDGKGWTMFLLDLRVKKQLY